MKTCTIMASGISFRKFKDCKLSHCLIPAVILTLSAGCGSNDPSHINTPDLFTVSPSSASAGDTIVVSGSGFSKNASSNRVVFSPCDFTNPYCRFTAVPFAASRSSISCIVPEGAFTGSIKVESVLPPISSNPFSIEPPNFDSNSLPLEITLLEGDVGKPLFSGTSFQFTIETGSQNEDYLMIIFNNSVPVLADDYFWYGITGDIRTSIASRGGDGIIVGSQKNDGNADRVYRDDLGIGSGIGELLTRGISKSRMIHSSQGGETQCAFERRLRHAVDELLSEYGETVPSSADDPALYSKIEGPGAAPQALEFVVLSDVYGDPLDPRTYTTVLASLKYEGDHTLLYVDEDTAPGCITDSEAEDLGRIFDEDIYQTNRMYFGEESDINGDRKVAVLLTPEVNKLTPEGTADDTGFIAGFFMRIDLLPGLINPDVRSDICNGMEIFYCMVPDPDAIYGNEFPREPSIEVMKGVLAHEFQHMINFNYRVLIYGNGYSDAYLEELWLDEGLSHIAEDLNGHDESNIGRSELFLLDPGAVTLVYGGDALDERGASFLFMRYLGDRFGESIYGKLVRSKHSGIDNVESASGMSFMELFADWSAAVYLSGMDEMISDGRYYYSSLPQAFNLDTLLVTDVDLLAGDIEGSVKSMGPEYLFMELPSGTMLDISIECLSNGRMNAVLVRLR